MEKKIGMNENEKQYTQKEIKILIKQAECSYKTNITKNSGRFDKFTFLSMIVNMNNELVGNNSKNSIRFITPDNNNKDEIYKEIKQTVNKAKQDHPGNTPPNILLIPYSADGHIVTLLVDKREFPKRNSVACFDSSHYFNKFGSLNPKHFSKDLIYTLDVHQKPINKSMIQKWSGTCSFYTEAFCYLVSEYIQNNEDKDIDLNSIREYINSKEFIKQLKDKKEEFFNEYKATMEEVEQKQHSMSKTQMGALAVRKKKTKGKQPPKQQNSIKPEPIQPTSSEESPDASQSSPYLIQSTTNSEQDLTSSSPSTNSTTTTTDTSTSVTQTSQQLTPQAQLERSRLIRPFSGTQASDGSNTELQRNDPLQMLAVPAQQQASQQNPLDLL